MIGTHGSRGMTQTKKVHLKGTNAGIVAAGDVFPWCEINLWFGDEDRLTDDIIRVTCGRCLRTKEGLRMLEDNHERHCAGP